MENITDADYIHVKRVFSKNAFKDISFRSCKVSFSSWISMASSFKKDRSKIRTIN